MNEINENAKIGKNCKFGTNVIIGPNVSIGDNNTFGNSNSFNEKSSLPSRSDTQKLMLDKPDEIVKNATFKYATARLTQQNAFISNISPTCRVLGVNPAGLDTETMVDYATTISEMLYAPWDDEQWNRIYCLRWDMWYATKLSQ